MDPYALLGLAPDADEMAIKRAYAQRLRKTRPDEDPEWFQRLNEAYRAALARSKSGQVGPRRGAWNRSVPVLVAAGQTGSQSATASTPIDTGAPREPKVRVVPLDPQSEGPHPHSPTFDPAGFIADFREQCAQGNAQALSRWLNQHPAFWNLPTKHAAGRVLLRALFEQPQQMSEACFATMIEFFHFDDTLGGVDPMLLRRVHHRGTIAWLLRSENHAELARRIDGRKTVQGIRLIRDAIKHASGPFIWWRDLPHTLFGDKFARQVARVLLYLCDGNLADLPPPFNRERARFWIEAASKAPSKSKLWVFLARTIAALLFIPLACAVIAAITTVFARPPNPMGIVIGTLWGLSIPTVAVLAIIWGCIGVAWLNRKLDGRARTSRRLRVALFCITPSSCVAALLVAKLVDPVLGVILALAVLAVAFMRSRTRRPPTRASLGPRLGTYAGLLLVALMLRGFGSVLARWTATSGLADLVPTLMVVAVTLGIWAWDWRKRGFLKART
jgi:hypothetical protein